MTENTALLVMDMQNGILGSFPGTAQLVKQVAEAIAVARQQQIPVIYVRVGFRQGAPEANVNNKSFGANREMYANMDMDAFMTIHPDLAPAKEDIMVTKRRISAFTGSDLEVVLRSLGISHMVLTGIATSGVVLSTIREAADKDYRLTVISDCCADRDDEVHTVLTTKVFTRQADVVTLAQWKNGN